MDRDVCKEALGLETLTAESSASLPSPSNSGSPGGRNPADLFASLWAGAAHGLVSVPPTLAAQSTEDIHFFKGHRVASDKTGFPLVRKWGGALARQAASSALNTKKGCQAPGLSSEQGWEGWAVATGNSLRWMERKKILVGLLRTDNKV